MSAERAVSAPERVDLTPDERRRRRSRSIAIGIVLAAVVVLFYVLTMAKLGASVLDRPL